MGEHKFAGGKGLRGDYYFTTDGVVVGKRKKPLAWINYIRIFDKKTKLSYLIMTNGQLCLWYKENKLNYPKHECETSDNFRKLPISLRILQINSQNLNIE